MNAKIILIVLMVATPLIAAEKPVSFVPATEDVAVGDYNGEGDVIAQVISTADGNYQANLLKAFDTGDEPLAILRGRRGALTGDGWSGSIQASALKLAKVDKQITLQHITRSSPTLGAPPPKDAVILFVGKSLDAWAKKAGKDWLRPDGPAPWKLVDGDAVEVVPGSDSIITREKFGDCHLHVEFRTLGAPTNSGVFLQTRYEVNINESYGRPDVAPTGGLDNCTQKIRPAVRAALPPLAWQTFDIDFEAPRFDAGQKIAPAHATVLLNGVKIYDRQALESPHGAASRLGEAPTGPLMLQEHGVKLQFRNIWLLQGKRATADVPN